jgi:hypothetical protein
MLSASGTLAQYAAELERTQQEGRLALHEAEHWVSEIQADEIKLAQAQRAVADAQGAITTAQSEIVTAGAAGPAGPALAATAAGQLRIAQAALSAAETAERNALEAAKLELTRWQRHGQQAWDDARAAGGRVGTHLQTLSIVPPPLAGLAAFPALSPTPPPGLEAPRRPGGLILPAKKGKGGKGKGNGEGDVGNAGRAKPHKPSGTGKSGYDRHTGRRTGLADKRPEFRKRPNGHRGPWPPK